MWRSMIEVVLVVAVAACGGSSPTMTDGGVGDGPLADVADGCVQMTGELIDWDSSTAAFKGVFGAKLSVPGDPTVILSTPPNGRLDTCVPASYPVRLDVDSPTDYLDGSMVVAQSALMGLYPISFRGITKTRAETFFAERGLTLDPGKAQVLVFAAGDRAEVTLDRTHAAAQAGNDDTQPGTFVWTDGDAGRYVLFPNVDVAQPTGSLGGDMAGPMSIPLAAGKLTFVAVTIIFI